MPGEVQGHLWNRRRPHPLPTHVHPGICEPGSHCHDWVRPWLADLHVNLPANMAQAQATGSTVRFHTWQCLITADVLQPLLTRSRETWVGDINACSLRLSWWAKGNILGGQRHFLNLLQAGHRLGPSCHLNLTVTLESR